MDLTSTLTGQFPFILLTGAILTLPVSVVVLRLYRRAVLKWMNLTTGSQTRASVEGPPEATPVGGPYPETVSAVSVRTGALMGSDLYQSLIRRPWISAGVYAAGGLAVAAVMAAGFLVSSDEWLPTRFLVLFAVYAWPVALTINLVATTRRVQRRLTIAIYLALLGLISAWAVVRNPELTVGQLVVLWSIMNVPPTALMAAVLNRRIRAVGPLVLVFMTIAVAGAIVALGIAGSSDALLRVLVEIAFAVGLGARTAFVAIVLVGLVGFGVFGWMGVRWIRRGYLAGTVTDQSLTLDAMWLMFALVNAVQLVFEGPLWILAAPFAFVVYKAVVRIGFKVVSPRLAGDAGRPLLLLRVFALARRSEEMFDTVTTHWRHVGRVQLIAGPDLARATVEPHELLEFVSGRLRTLFVRDDADLDRRVSGLDIGRNADQRFPVIDFFCHANTWKAALDRLVASSRVVLVDLRGFTSANAGVRYELGELVSVVPVERTVLIVDETTEREALDALLASAWHRMRDDSPNRARPVSDVKLYRLRSTDPDALVDVLPCLVSAAA